jgi:hypothetical protein
MTRFRLSASSMKTTVTVAAAMTATLAGLVWMVLTARGDPRALWWTLGAGTTFFAFCSAALLWRWLRGEAVLAVLPTGLYDARWRAEPVAWEEIRDLVLRRAEDEFSIDVHLWRPQGQAGARPDHTIEISPLEGGVARIVEAIGRHAPVRIETVHGAGMQAGHAITAREPM